jgi:ABC-type sugar transport system substrate-binding protein
MGRSMAIWIAEKLHGKGNVVLLSGIAGASPAELRAAAAVEAQAISRHQGSRPSVHRLEPSEG